MRGSGGHPSTDRNKIGYRWEKQTNQDSEGGIEGGSVTEQIRKAGGEIREERGRTYFTSLRRSKY